MGCGFREYIVCRPTRVFLSSLKGGTGSPLTHYVSQMPLPHQTPAGLGFSGNSHNPGCQGAASAACALGLVTSYQSAAPCMHPRGPDQLRKVTGRCIQMPPCRHTAGQCPAQTHAQGD